MTGTASGRRPPTNLPAAQVCLFLDFDGTLAEFAPTPGAVRLLPGTIPLLRGLAGRLGGALAVVSGRCIADLDERLQPLRLPMAGLHGFERRDARGQLHRPHLGQQALDPARDVLQRAVQEHEGLLLEDKGASLVLHYRAAPGLAREARAAAAAAAARLAGGFALLEGDKVIEIKPSGFDKAHAVEQFMGEAPFRGRVPVFVGDDVTDRDGFGAVRRHDGITIAVGERVRALYQLPDPQALFGWLAQVGEPREPAHG